MIHKMGIIGFGGMGEYHFSCISERLRDCVEVKGVFDVREERQQHALERGLLAYGSREALLSDPEIDLVLVATPNNRRAQARQELRLRKARHPQF